MKAKIIDLLISYKFKHLEFDTPVQLSTCNVSGVDLNGLDIEECGDPHADRGHYDNLDNDDLHKLAQEVELQIESNEKAYKRVGIYD